MKVDGFEKRGAISPLNGMAERVLSGIVVFFCLVGTISCRHAWIRYPQRPPQVCEKTPDSKDCKRELEIQAEKAALKGPVHIVHQNYYLFGYYPRSLILDTSKYCSGRPKSVHQYTSAWDGFLEQITFTIYSPQTVEVECYQL